jgi:hypothetical protein
MKTIKLAYDVDNTVHTWKAQHDARNGGWVVTDHEGDSKFFSGCIEAVVDHMQRVTLPNWGMRLLGVR